MRKGRLAFWSISGVLIAAGAGEIVWLKSRPDPVRVEAAPSQQGSFEDVKRRDDRPPEPWEPAEKWWKRTTLDAYDAANSDKLWPCARRAIVAFARSLSDDPPKTGDEASDWKTASEVALDYGCDDPLMMLVRGHYLAEADEGSRHFEAAALLAKSATALRADARYPAFVRCVANYRAAAAVAVERYGPRDTAATKPTGFITVAEALLPEVAADRQLPLNAVLWLTREVITAARNSGRDCEAMCKPLVAAMEKGGQSRSAVLTITGEYLTEYAWQARGGGTANTVTSTGWQKFGDRLRQARTAFETAWAADQKNTFAAAGMITVCMGDGSGRAEMEKWFSRALEADPGNFDACGRKLLCLEPKWGGSPSAMILFGRELTRRPADPRAVRIPVALVNAHWTLATLQRDGDQPDPAYFADNPDAWDDVTRVYETYLKKVPGSRYHRTRYAVVAAWAGRWDVANAQFDRLGDRADNSVVPPSTLKAIRDRAKRETAGEARPPAAVPAT